MFCQFLLLVGNCHYCCYVIEGLATVRGNTHISLYYIASIFDEVINQRNLCNLSNFKLVVNNYSIDNRVTKHFVKLKSSSAIIFH